MRCRRSQNRTRARVVSRTAGEGLSEEDRIRSAAEHLPAAGDRPDAEGAGRRAVDAGRPQAGHRRNDHHVGEPARRAGLHVRRAHTERLAQGLRSCQPPARLDQSRRFGTVQTGTETAVFNQGLVVCPRNIVSDIVNRWQ